MKPVPVLLTAAVLAAIPALRAQELQMTFSGSAACSPTLGCAPWLVSFDIDTASGPQVQGLITVGGVTYVSSFGANLDVSNFVESLGGNDFHGAAHAFVPTASAALNFNNLPLQQAPVFQLNVLNFDWLSAPQPSPTQLQFNTRRYPLQSYLLSFNGEQVSGNAAAALLPGLGVLSETAQIGVDAVRITVTPVPEPGALALLVSGLLAAACVRRRAARYLARLSGSNVGVAART